MNCSRNHLINPTAIVAEGCNYAEALAGRNAATRAPDRHRSAVNINPISDIRLKAGNPGTENSYNLRVNHWRTLANRTPIVNDCTLTVTHRTLIMHDHQKQIFGEVMKLIDKTRDLLRSKIEESRIPILRVAKETGVSRGTINNFLDGKKVPTEDTLQKIIAWCGVTKDELMPRGTIDQTVFTQVCTVVEEVAKKWGHELPPETKAAIISVLYSVRISSEVSDASVEQLIDLVSHKPAPDK